MVALALACLVVAVPGGPAAAQPAEADVLVAQAILAYEAKRHDEALVALQQALAVNPNHVDALYYTALVHIARGRPAEAGPPLERARTLAPDDALVAYQLGALRLSEGKPAEAERHLEQAFSTNPRLDGLGYYLGFVRYQKGDYPGALRAFEAGVSTSTTINQLSRFYSALALGRLGFPERAAAQVEEAIRLQPASPLTGAAERLRDAVLAAREGERRFRAEARVGVFFDTNVSVSPRPSSDAIAEAVRRDREARDDVETPGELLALRLDYSWLRSGPWEATVGYSFFQTINNGASAFNIQDHLAALGGVYRGAVGDMPFQVGAQYVFDYLTLGGDRYLQRHSGTLYGTLVESPRHLTTVQGRVERKEFADDPPIPAEVQDATNWLAGITHTLRFAGGRHLVRIGYQLDVEQAAGRNYDYTGHRALVGLQYTLPFRGLRLKYEFDLHYQDYDNRNTILPAAAPGTRARKDTEQTHIVRIELPLPHGLTLAAEYQHAIARSNLAPFSYDRDVYSLILSWQY